MLHAEILATYFGSNLIDLFGNLMLEVINATDESSTKGKTSALIAIAGRKNTKPFDIMIDMLNINPSLRNSGIKCLFF